MGRVPRDRAGGDHGAPSRARSALCSCRARWLRRATVAFALGFALVVLGGSAHAEPQTSVALAYEIAPDTEGCPQTEVFESTVTRQLGYDPFRSSAGRHIAVRIARKDAGFEGFIQWTDARGQRVGDRRLSSPRSECSEIAANVAFAVAVQIQLLAALEPDSPESGAPTSSATGSPGSGSQSTSPATAPPGEPASGVKTPSPTPPNGDTSRTTSSSREKSRPGRFRLSAGLGPSLAVGMAPHVTGLGRIFVSGRFDPLSLELAVDAALPASRRQPDGSGFSLDRIAAGAAACGHVHVFAACLTATVGRLEARGFGVDKPASPAGLFSQLGARIAATQGFGDRYFAAARLEGLVMLSPWTVTLADNVAWSTPRFGGLFGLDFGVYFF